MGAYDDTTATITNTVNITGYRKTYAGQTTTSMNNATNGTTGRAGWASYAWVGMTNVANPAQDNKGGTRPVGTLLANELGIHDMSGNVSEWCWDWIAGGGDQGLPSIEATSDYRGPDSGERKLAHGGEYRNNTPNRPSIWYRTGFYRQIGINDIGIRLVQTTGNSGGITIGYDPVDPAKITITGVNVVLLRRDNEKTFTVTATEGNTYEWYLNGKEVDANTTNTYTVNGNNTAILTYVGTYTVRVVVTTASRKTYSNTVTFRVGL
jgi:hypothetical protein